jgi:hypothetical protein
MYKDFNQATDISTQTGVVNEVIPLTGTFFSGSPPTYLKNYVNITSGSAVSGGFFATIYDGSPSSLSSSALLDLTMGISSGSVNVTYAATFIPAEKQRVYKEMARYLLGADNQFFNFNNTNYHECFFLCFKRRLYKDEIKKGTMSINLQLASDTLTLTDAGAAGNYDTTPGGDRGPLYSGSTVIGSVYYNAGIVVFPTGVFVAPAAGSTIAWSGSYNLNQIMSGNIDQAVDGFRNRVNQVTFQNQTNLHSTVYFCRALNSEFNYSTNPSFVASDGRIIPTSGSDNQTRSYITSVGLYDINDNLLAVAKLSQPVKKSPDSEVTVRVKLSY